MTKEEKRKEYLKKYYENNKKEILEKQKQYRKNNKEKYNKYMKIYCSQWCENNKEKVLEKNKRFRENNKEKRNKYSKEYRENNKEYYNEYQNNRKKTDPLFKLRCNLSTRIYIVLKNKNYIKSKRTLEMLGCDLHTAKAHLEKQFTKGMTWDNQGKWHIDHIIPCTSAKTEEELIKLFHYTNLQPLWAFDNLSKGKKIIEKQLFLL
jgi:hypothetical protein